jgi:hypothetical protein
VIPPFDPRTGRLPRGEHHASWEEVVERFGWNERRRRLIDGLADAVTALADAGCRRLWLNGSFVTAKDEPGDFDADLLDPVLLTCPTVVECRRTRSLANCSRT